MTALPTPKNLVLCKLNVEETAEMIERHVDFYKTDKDGNRISVHLPTPFVRHFMKRHDTKLPTCVAVSQTPVVLPDGSLLAPPGLHRPTGIDFWIADELMAVLPRPEDCTPNKVEDAMRFLTDEWLCDVATDFAGKCKIIAVALTIIERSVLDQRPAFWVTAGRRGGGKTTTLAMVITAVTGRWPQAAAWSTNEEERRKALLSYFMYGVSYILWDNIARGTRITCPHIEKSCTAAYYSDRKLGVSEMVATAASTIHLFTGNNICPTGDLASRSLEIRLDLDRADPENRAFRHPDPVGWSNSMRAELMAAFYTILLGNPALQLPRDAPMPTKFKMWQRMVGSAIEHAAQLVVEGTPPGTYEPDDRAKPTPISFADMFLAGEDEDDDSASLADALAILSREWPTTFDAKDVAELANNQIDPKGATLRDFLHQGASTPPGHVTTAKSVGRLLKRHLDEPVTHGDRTLILRSTRARTNSLEYYVHIAQPE